MQLAWKNMFWMEFFGGSGNTFEGARNRTSSSLWGRNLNVLVDVPRNAKETLNRRRLWKIMEEDYGRLVWYKQWYLTFVKAGIASEWLETANRGIQNMTWLSSIEYALAELIAVGMVSPSWIKCGEKWLVSLAACFMFDFNLCQIKKHKSRQTTKSQRLKSMEHKVLLRPDIWTPLWW